MFLRLWARAKKRWLDSPENKGHARSRPPELLYAVDETPPWPVLIVAGLQHVALISNSLVYPIILGREANLSSSQLLDLVSVSMLMLGLSSILLCAKGRFIGSGYLCPAGYTQIYLGPSLFAAQIGGLSLVFGMTFLTGVLQLALAPLLRRARVFLPPEIAGLVIAIVGLSIAVLGIRYSLGIAHSGEIQPSYLAVAGVALGTMVVLNVWTKGYSRVFCGLIGIAVGYVVSIPFHIADMPASISGETLKLFRVPSLDFFDWSFNLAMVAPFSIVVVAGTLHLMGNISTAQRINDTDWARPNLRSINGGLVANGIASMLCGVLGSMGMNSYSSSIGLSTATSITSRSLAYVIGGAFAILAMMPPAVSVITAMPPPVIGAALFFTAAFVFINGLQIITARLLDSRKIIVIGFSFAAAVMADVYHDVFQHAPLLLRPILDNALVLGTFCAVLLNLLTRIGIRKTVTMHLAAGPVDRSAIEQFLFGQGAQWGARRDVVTRAIFGTVQSIELLEALPPGAVIAASFDEFNLDVRITYPAAPIVIPEKRPTPREIMASEEGERLLAGYLLRRSADRISCRKLGDGAEIQLHYDH